MKLFALEESSHAARLLYDRADLVAVTCTACGAGVEEVCAVVDLAAPGISFTAGVPYHFPRYAAVHALYKASL